MRNYNTKKGHFGEQWRFRVGADLLFLNTGTMGKAKKTRKFAEVKRMINPKDARLKENKEKQQKKEEEKVKEVVRHIPQVASSMFFKYNSALGPPYHVLVDTNFINFSIQNKLELVKAMMDCLYAKSIPCITDCVMAELEKLGPKYRIALRVARDPRFERLPCSHKGTYADDCLVQRVMQHKCYIVATCDKDLKRRIRKVPGIPIMYISQRKYVIERLPELGGNHLQSPLKHQEAQHAQQAQQGHYPTSPDGAILESGTAPPQLIEWARQLGLAKGPQVKSDGVGGLRTTEEGLSAQGEADEEDSNKVVERTPTKVELDEAVSPPDAESKSIGENLSEYDREMDAMEPTANGYQLRKSHCKQRRLTRRRKIYLFFEKPRSVPAKIFAAVSILCILISVALTLIQSLPWFDATTWIYYYSVWLPLDCAVTAVFMIDYVCRLYGADNRWKFIIQPMNIIDLITIVPFYITLAVPWESQYAIRAIRILRLFRIFRIFQFSKYSVGLHITTRVFLHSIEQLLLVSVYLLIVLLISSTLMFYAERGEFNNGDWQWYRWNPNSSQWEVSPYQSIIHSLYWSVVTVTTTGYGDIVPFTVVGRLIAGITMICGILTIALPTSIVGSNFTNEWQLWRRIQTQNKIKEAQKATQGNADMIKGALRKMSKRDKIKVLEDQNLSMLEVVAEMQDRLSELNPPRYYHKYKIEQAAHTETKRKLQEVENELAKLRKAHQNLAKFNSLFRGHHSSQDNEDSLTLTKTNESSNTTMGSSRLSKLFSRHTHNTDKDEPQSKSPFPTLSRTLTGDSKDSETNFSERVREKSSSIANTVKHGWKIASHKDNPSPQRAMTEPVTAIPDNDDDSSAPLLQQSTIHHDSPSSSLSANQGRTSSLPTYVEEPRYDEGEHDKPGRPEVAPEPSHHCQSGTEPTDTIPGQSAATRFQALFSDPADSVSSHEDPVGTGVQHPLRDNMLAPNQSTTSLSSSSHIGSRVSTPDGYVAPYMMTDMISREPERTHHYEGN
ncbi:hypothetical protein BZG36_00592 [Bifiguratus adelaidae]|uniref:PIN domain-containing protein n=1 Tax=Bifiguratus adelaidae TaxID=1938954 RepID=A0A261Y7J1_9FUNG|nr:hypothetical protein BZG36_00592 [Bifiguratus adelaidae]